MSDVAALIRKRRWEAAQQVISHITDQLHRVHADDHPSHLGIVTEMHEGRPADVIPERATALPADLIAIGARGLRTPDEFRIGATAYKVATHGRSGLSRVLIGSVADKVRRGADMPVLLYRPQASQTAGRAAGEARV